MDATHLGGRLLLGSSVRPPIQELPDRASSPSPPLFRCSSSTYSDGRDTPSTFSRALISTSEAGAAPFHLRLGSENICLTVRTAVTVALHCQANRGRHLFCLQLRLRYTPRFDGELEGKHLSHSSFMPAKSSSSASTMVTLTILSNELPASSRMACIFVRHCAVCS